jgi:hypothetical protein
MNFSTRSIYLSTLLLAGVSSFAADSEEGAKTGHAAMTASNATAQTIRSHISGLFFGGTSFYRLSQSRDGDRAAAWDEGQVSFSLTPTIVSVNNKVNPIHNSGTVGVVVGGIEHFDEIDTITGLTLSIDTLRVTSTEIASGANPAVDTRVTGTGLTVAPYFARQLESGWLFDASLGIGSSSMKTNTNAVTAKPKTSRTFVSAGLSKNEGIADDSIILSKKLAFSHSNDSVKAFTLSDNTTISSSRASLSQIKGSLGLSWPSEKGTPYVEAGVSLNSFAASGGGSIKPKEHSATYQGKIGYRVISGDYYGDLSYQMERDKSRLQLYVGRRF